VLIVGLYAGALPRRWSRRRRTGALHAVALGYNIPLGIVGGLTPMAATWLVARTGDDLSPPTC
jgi:MHS family proline/betaine transporter-like MFS transporter